MSQLPRRSFAILRAWKRLDLIGPLLV